MKVIEAHGCITVEAFVMVRTPLCYGSQILNGGRWQPGSCGQPGEEAEQVNSYISRAGFVTKTMTKSGE